MDDHSKYYFKWAFGLAVFTIAYNLVEGLICTILGYADESLSLFGFGVDSFIETISGMGILHMVQRIQRNPDSNRDAYERTALRITGFAFYALVAGLVSTGIYNIRTGHQPDTTLVGLVISLVSISVMWALLHYKVRVGLALKSDAILADASCTRVCIYMSVVLLAASGLYYFWRLPYTDSLGAFALAWLSWKEGRECFEKARSDKYCSC